MDINFNAVLKEIFPGVSDQALTEVIGLVINSNPFDSNEGKLENMVNLLMDNGAWGPLPVPVLTNQVDEVPLQSQYETLMNFFPEANPDYLWRFCQEREAYFNLEDAIQELSQGNYERIEVDPLVIWEQLKDALPNADPWYLKKEANRLALLPRQDLDNFLQNAIEKNDYPTMQEYLQHKKQHDELSLYKNQFNVDRFLEVIPNPVEQFANVDRKMALDNDANENDVQYALTFLYNHYNFIRKRHIDLLFKWKNKNLIEICEKLDKMGKEMRKPRPFQEGVDTKNIALLQEIAYLKNRKLIKHVIKHKDEQYRLAKEEARKYNLLEKCKCCYDEELIPEECYFCMKGCIFCKECLKNGTDNVIGKGDIRFPCFNNCNSEFSLQTLQMVLPKKTFERLIQKIASEEIKKSNVEGLETCPFCDFAMILPENEKIFKCINHECLIESCRQCRHKSHIPLRCSEIEYDEDVRRRTFIENKMTEALTRTCYSCKKTFIKSTGCNKMTCLCGAMMCYICGVSVNNYNHFGDGRCPLFTNDVEINLQRVITGAQNAKQELGNVEIKFDPSTNIETFFRG